MESYLVEHKFHLKIKHLPQSTTNNCSCKHSSQADCHPQESTSYGYKHIKHINAYNLMGRYGQFMVLKG